MSSEHDSMKNRIKQQLESLDTNPHIETVQKISALTYNLLYHPSETNSLYRQNTYKLQLKFPQTYPNDPPSLRFLTPIYHLNVGQSSGEVRMAVLEDQWSPFLSLFSIIESLDSTLEEPQKDYALQAQILEIFQRDRKKYLSKVLKNVEQDEKDQENKVSVSKIQVENGLSPLKINKSEKLVQSLRQSMVEIQNQNDIQAQLINLQNKLTEKKQSSGKKVGSTSSIAKQVKPSKQTINMDIARSIDMLQIPRNYSKVISKSKTVNFEQRQYQKKKINHNNTSQIQVKGNLTLGKINQTINAFIIQLNQIEEQMSLTRNQGILSLLREKYDSQLEMLRQLMNLSEDTKRKIVRKLKDEVYNM